MDVQDAAVYAYRFDARIPKPLKVVLWGPLQAKELGLSDWIYQDGGETGFVYHCQPRAVGLGRAFATLVYVRRQDRATLTLTLAGYPADAPEAQRRLDVSALVSEAEVFLNRLSPEPVKFARTREVELLGPGPVQTAPAEPAVASRARDGPVFEV